MQLLRSNLVLNDDDKKARIITFVNPKGGQLKSTSAVNVAGAILKDEPGAKVLIVDTDLQANVFTAFGQEADMLKDGADLSAAILSPNDRTAILNTIYCLYNNGENGFIDCITSNERCNSLEMTTLKTFFRDLCAELESYYDYIMIDTPPASSLLVANVFLIDRIEVFVPFEPDMYSLRGVLKATEQFNTILKENPSARFGGVFATKVKGNAAIHSTIIDKVKEITQSDRKVYLKTFIPSSIRESGSVYYEALPVVLSTKKSAVGTAYLELFKEIK